MSADVGKRPVVYHPLSVRMKNTLGFFLPKPRLVMDDIITEAETHAGCTDWGHPGFQDGLYAFISAFNRARLPLETVKGAKVILMTGAIRRLRMYDLLRKHPEIEDTPIPRPIFISGMPRTGSTLLQRLLSADPEHRPLLYWEALSCTPPPEPEGHAGDPRIAGVQAMLDGFSHVAPDFQSVHHSAAAEPDECNPIFQLAFASPTLCARYPLPDYARWFAGYDMREAYRLHKQYLQILAWKFPARTWVCKAPAHLEHLPALFDIYPDARVVLTHRDPAAMVASSASMVRYMRHIFAFGAGGDARTVGMEMNARLAAIWKRAGLDREHLPADRFVDVAYHRLIQDPMACVEDLYRTLHIPLSDAARTAMTAWLADNGRGKHGNHRYHLSWFGLTRDQVDATFADYLARYGAYLA